MTDNEPRWMDCTVPQWNKKAELSLMNGDMGQALMFADYANARDMYDNGMEVEQIQDRLNPDGDFPGYEYDG